MFGVIAAAATHARQQLHLSVGGAVSWGELPGLCLSRCALTERHDLELMKLSRAKAARSRGEAQDRYRHILRTSSARWSVAADAADLPVNTAERLIAATCQARAQCVDLQLFAYYYHLLQVILM